MARCDHCGNDYDKSFELARGGERWTFDSIECAVQVVAPVCERCGCRILGHGTEADGVYYCGAHCARASGEKGLRDRA
jgi:hypothetical protein